MKWTLEKRNIGDLHEYAKNPRTLSKEQGDHLHESISKFGQCEPIVINVDNIVIGGHQRLRTLRKLRYKEVDVYVPNEALSDKDVEELNIRLNRNVGDWDFDMLANAWDFEDLTQWGFSLKDLHVDDLGESGGEGEEEKLKNCTMNIKFSDPEHLQEAENRISTIIDEYKGATYKVKVK